MARGKKGFVLYCDLIHTFSQLTTEERGILVTHILEYVNDLNPEPLENRVLQIAFEPIKQQLKRDLKHWESVVEKRKESGSKGGKQKVANASKSYQNVANVAVIDKVIDKVIVKDIVINNNNIEGYFQDLENSQELETIARLNKLSVEYLRSRIPEFKKKADVSYPNFNRFANHFKNWVLLNPTKINKTKELK